MTSQSEKLEFSKRLKKALAESKHPISPTYLSNEFNNRYDGQPVSVQSANNWLLGKAIPNQDKLLVLSIWLKVSTQWLRFGEDNSSATGTSTGDYFSQSDIELLYKLNKLTLEQKKILNLIIDEFIHSS